MKQTFLILATLFLLSAMADPKDSEPYPHLNSWGDKPAKCGLKPEEATWLEEQIEEGKLRVATPEDVKAWEEMAKKKGWTKPMIDCGRTFVILEEMHIEGAGILFFVTFIVSEDAPFPTLLKLGSPFYDLKTGGVMQSGMCAIGKEEWICRNPRNRK